MFNRINGDYSLSIRLITFALFLILFTSLPVPFSLAAEVAAAGNSVCEFNFSDGHKLFRYTLASPLPDFPHGVLSEDGFYKVAANDSVLWFQLCDGMIFNHDPPKCVGCLDCGGSAQCGVGCSALVANNIEGYHVCTAIGHNSNFDITLIDKHDPHNGVIVKMTSSTNAVNCSLSVSVLCDSKAAEGPVSLQRSGACDYAAELRHPSGCATILTPKRKWGWFAVLFTILLCTLAAYLLAGGVYRYYFLDIRGVEVIPNLDFWSDITSKTQSIISPVLTKFGLSSYSRSSSSYATFDT